MDPDADRLDRSPPPPPYSSGRRNRGVDHHRGNRTVSQEVALPNSSRRAANRRARRGNERGGDERGGDERGDDDRGDDYYRQSSSGSGGRAGAERGTKERGPKSSSSSTSRYKSREERSLALSAAGSVTGSVREFNRRHGQSGGAGRSSRKNRHRHLGRDNTGSDGDKDSDRESRRSRRDKDKSHHNHRDAKNDHRHHGSGRERDSDEDSDKESGISRREKGGPRRREREGDKRHHKSDNRKHQPSSSSRRGEKDDKKRDRRRGGGGATDSDGDGSIGDDGGYGVRKDERPPFDSDRDDVDYSRNGMEDVDEGTYDHYKAYLVKEGDDMDEMNDDDGDDDEDFREDIEDMSYNEHCGDTTYYSDMTGRTDKTGKSGKSGKTGRTHDTSQRNRGAEDSEDSDFEQSRRGDAGGRSRKKGAGRHGPRERAKEKKEPVHHGGRERAREREGGGGGGGGGAGGGPELNANHGGATSDLRTEEELRRLVPPPPLGGHPSEGAAAADERAGHAGRAAGVGGGGTDAGTATDLVPMARQSSDPPTAQDHRRLPSAPPRSKTMDPQFDEDSSLLSRFNAPPTLAGPHRTKRFMDPQSHANKPPSKNMEPRLDEDGSVLSRFNAPPSLAGPQRARRFMEPQFDENRSLFSRYDAPPTPAGPERNRRAVVAREARHAGGRSAGGYSTYALDEEGIRQYKESHGLDSLDRDADDGASRATARGQDPPEAGRGNDPKQVGSADPPEAHGNVYRPSGGKHRGGGGRSRGGKGRSGGEDAPASPDAGRKPEKRERKKKPPPPPQPEIKGILKKKNAPIPITQFGKPVISDGPPPPVDSEDGLGGSEASGSDPEVTEEKSRHSAPPAFDLGGANRDDDTVDGTVRSHGTKGGLRSGKYASYNAAAARRRSEEEGGGSDDDGSGDSESDVSRDYTEYTGYTDYTGDYGEEEDDDDDGAHKGRHINSGSGSDDEDTLQSIKSSADVRYDRSRSNFMRTADLGLTQDTIFAEQFLDDPSARPEPHYHHPSPHPPPGVQFHIDENWVCLDDGRGSHSPIAPQAVDALVAMGYRAACDPMMWTPTSKTRKYMTEKGLRFDDVPIPGPSDEGEGGPGDSTCLVWSGKFPHKYHGHEQPAVRSQGIVNMSPEDLVDLLMDSTRVSEYNKSCIGRTDEVVLSDGTDLDSCPFSGQRKKKLTGVVMQGAKVVDGNAVFDSETDDEQSELEEIEELVFDDDGVSTTHTITTSTRRDRRKSLFVGVTKLVRTTNKPPLVRKVLEFFTLLHCRALTDDQGGDGFIIVGRGITSASDAERGAGKGVKRSEILLNVHIVRRLRSSKRRREKGSGGKGSRSSKYVYTSGRKASKGDLADRCLMINVNHLKSPMVPNMLAKKVGLSAALNFMSDIRGLTDKA